MGRPKDKTTGNDANVEVMIVVFWFDFNILIIHQDRSQQHNRNKVSFDSIMSLECLAILGQKNEPLYVCASSASTSDLDPSGNKRKDAFGFFDPTSSSSPSGSNETTVMTTNISVRHEVSYEFPAKKRVRQGFSGFYSQICLWSYVYI